MIMTSIRPQLRRQLRYLRKAHKKNPALYQEFKARLVAQHLARHEVKV